MRSLPLLSSLLLLFCSLPSCDKDDAPDLNDIPLDTVEVTVDGQTYRTSLSQGDFVANGSTETLAVGGVDEEWILSFFISTKLDEALENRKYTYDPACDGAANVECLYFRFENDALEIETEPGREEQSAEISVEIYESLVGRAVRGTFRGSMYNYDGQLYELSNGRYNVTLDD